MSLDGEILSLLVHGHLGPDGIFGASLEPAEILLAGDAGPGDEWAVDADPDEVARIVDAAEVVVGSTALEALVVERQRGSRGDRGPAIFVRTTETRARRTGLLVRSRLERWFDPGAEPPDRPPDQREELELLSTLPQ